MTMIRIIKKKRCTGDLNDGDDKEHDKEKEERK